MKTLSPIATRARKLIFIALISLLAIAAPSLAFATPEIVELDASKAAKLTAEKIGIGGGGALFSPEICPHDPNEMVVRADMGGLYVTHNAGETWNRANLHGIVLFVHYDRSKPGVMYAGGSGVWKSTDYGKTWNLFMPTEDDFLGIRLNNSNPLQHYFSKSGTFDYSLYMKDLLVDPADPKHVFALGWYQKKFAIYETHDGGATYSKTSFDDRRAYWNNNIHFDFSELIYNEDTKTLFVICSDGVYKYTPPTTPGGNDAKLERIYTSVITQGGSTFGALRDVATVKDENGKTTFIVSEHTNDRADAVTKVYYTHDFTDENDRVDITDKLTASKPTTFSNANCGNKIDPSIKGSNVAEKYGEVTFKYKFRYIAATSLDNIYVTNWAEVNELTSTGTENYPYIVSGIIHYNGTDAKYLYGIPYKDHNNLASRGWADGNLHALGISAYESDTIKNRFLFTTLTGMCLGLSDNEIHPRYFTRVSGNSQTDKGTFVTNGIDEQSTHATHTDPFNSNNRLICNTDLGLIRSTDGGKSWAQAKQNIPGNWVNTCYDAIYNKRKQDVVYSIWSGTHDRPANPGDESNAKGGFAMSTDGGASWDINYSSGIPANSIPIKMFAVYPEDSDEITIYVATFNNGFYKSIDSGKTFVAINDGITPVKYSNDAKHSFIFAQDITLSNGRIFALTRESNFEGAYNNGTKPQRAQLFEFYDDAWHEIAMPAEIAAPRNICYYDHKMYVSCTPTSKWENKGNGYAFNCYNGGVWCKDLSDPNSTFEQIFDESNTTTSVVFDSLGTMFISDAEGNIYRREEGKEAFEKIYADYHYISKSMRITEDDDTIHLSTLGGGMLELSNLKELYDHEHTGGTATCIEHAKCSICGQEYGALSENHVYDEGQVTQEPTTEAPGIRTFSCTLCGNTKTESIPKLPNQEDGTDDPPSGGQGNEQNNEESDGGSGNGQTNTGNGSGTTGNNGNNGGSNGQTNPSNSGSYSGNSANGGSTASNKQHSANKGSLSSTGVSRATEPETEQETAARFIDELENDQQDNEETNTTEADANKPDSSTQKRSNSSFFPLVPVVAFVGALGAGVTAFFLIRKRMRTREH